MKQYQREHSERINARKRAKYDAGWREKPHYQPGYLSAWTAGDPARSKAHRAVAWAVKNKNIVRLRTCQRCAAKDRKVHAHHEDYNKPLAVIWLCISCHRRLHSGAISKSFIKEL